MPLQKAATSARAKRSQRGGKHEIQYNYNMSVYDMSNEILKKERFYYEHENYNQKIIFRFSANGRIHKSV